MRAAFVIERRHAVDTIRILVVSIITQLRADIKENEKTAGHTYRQAGNIDKRVTLVLA